MGASRIPPPSPPDVQLYIRVLHLFLSVHFNNRSIKKKLFWPLKGQLLFIPSESIKWVLGTPRDLMLKSKWSPQSDSTVEPYPWCHDGFLVLHFNFLTNLSWLYVRIMSHTYFRVNPQSMVAWLSAQWLSCVVSTYLYGTFDCMFLSCHVCVSEWIQVLYLPECQGTPCSKQVQYLKFTWLQWDWNPQPPSS